MGACTATEAQGFTVPRQDWHRDADQAGQVFLVVRAGLAAAYVLQFQFQLAPVDDGSLGVTLQGKMVEQLGAPCTR